VYAVCDVPPLLGTNVVELLIPDVVVSVEK
jgi:hypothetical protein